MQVDPRRQVIEWMCSYCGEKQTKSKNSGKPLPGKCHRKSNGGPHVWRINRRIV